MAQDKPRNICAAILAAGQSRRFGEADKLAQPLGGTMLGLHIAATVSGLNCEHKLVIASAADHPCAEGWRNGGFAVEVNDKAEEGLGTSVALAAKQAASCGARGLLVCLADMPSVPIDHLERLMAAFEAQSGKRVVASHGGRTVSPPAIFGEALFPHLSGLSGSGGARALLLAADKIAIAADLLADIDTVAEFLQAGGRQSDLSP